MELRDLRVAVGRPSSFICHENNILIFAIVVAYAAGAAAAKVEKDAAVMMANDSDKAIPLSCDFQGRSVVSCRITDKNRTDATISFPAELPPRSFLVAIVK